MSESILFVPHIHQWILKNKIADSEDKIDCKAKFEWESLFLGFWWGPTIVVLLFSVKKEC